jgi:uncharacterized membrane protein
MQRSDRTLRILAALVVGLGVAIASFLVLRWILTTFVSTESDMLVIGAVVLMVVPLMIGSQIGLSVYDRITGSEDDESPADD